MTVRNWRATRTESVMYILPGNTVYDLHSPPERTVISMSGWGLLTPTIETIQLPYQDGVLPLAIRLPSRKIEVTIHHRGRSRDDYWQIRTALANAFRSSLSDPNNPSMGTLRWARSDGQVFDVDCILTSGFSVDTQWGSHSIRETLSFTAFNPYIYNPTLNSESLTGFDATNPQTMSISYAGNGPSFPIIKVTGPCDSITIENTSTHKSLVLDYAPADGEVVTFLLTYATKEITNDAGDNLLGYLDITSSSLFEFAIQPHLLATEGTNDIEFDLPGGNANTKAQVYYYNTYVGI